MTSIAQQQQIGSTPTMVAATPNLNSNAQAALMILLTAQMQQQAGDASLLQDPQVVGILQNLVNTATDPSSGGNDMSLTELMSNPVLSPMFTGAQQPRSVGWGAKGAAAPAPVTNNASSAENKENGRPTLLDTPKGRPILLADPAANNGQVTPPQAPKDASPTPPIVANNLNNLLNAQNLSELLGSITASSVAAETSQAQKTVPVSSQVTISAPPTVSSHQQQQGSSLMPPRSTWPFDLAHLVGMGCTTSG